MNMTQTLEQLTGSPLAACSDRQIYLALLELVRRKAGERREPVRGRKLYYISAEFLIGKLLSNNLINLGLYDQVRTALADAGKNYQIGVSFNSAEYGMAEAAGTFNEGNAPLLIAPSNLELRESNTATSININELRQAIAIQHILEADARGGTRYTELLKNEFGVTSPDSRLQRTEYIGGTRITININQVIQQSATNETSPQGNTAADFHCKRLL